VNSENVEVSMRSCSLKVVNKGSAASRSEMASKKNM
jgi:hypothetical protein